MLKIHELEIQSINQSISQSVSQLVKTNKQTNKQTINQPTTHSLNHSTILSNADRQRQALAGPEAHLLRLSLLSYHTGRRVSPSDASTLRPAIRAGPLRKSHGGVS